MCKEVRDALFPRMSRSLKRHAFKGRGVKVTITLPKWKGLYRWGNYCSFDIVNGKIINPSTINDVHEKSVIKMTEAIRAITYFARFDCYATFEFEVI